MNRFRLILASIIKELVMKKIIEFKKVAFLTKVLIVFTLLGLGNSCTNEFNESDFPIDQSTEPPIIISVSEAREDTPVQQGVLENVYYIRGEHLGSLTSIKYNGYEAGYNPVYVTDNLIISQIPEEAPYLNGINKLRIETLYGVTEYDFSLLTITEFTEEIIDGKSAVILHGGDFSEVNRVLFVSGTEEAGNLVEREATIMQAVTQTNVVVEVPAGVVQAFIYVFSRGAVVQSASYGFNYPIFTDALNGWTIGGWDGSQELSSEIALGSTSIKRESLNWGGLTLFPEEDAEDLVVADYRTVSFQIYPANSETTRVNLAFNDFSVIHEVDLIPGQWNKLVIPLNEIFPAGTAPETITRIDFQEASGSTSPPFLFYLDNFGFIQ